jgi:hypothetical protein
MAKWFGATVVALGLMLGGSASADTPDTFPVAARRAQHAAPISDASARHRYPRPRYHAAARPPYTSYYGRPVYYAPAPFVPLPPFFGYGWEPW